MMFYYFGGPFWNNPQLWFDRSPIRYVKNARTPTLIQAGGADKIVPISQAYQWYHALRATHVPVNMLIYTKQGHNFSDPNMIVIGLKDLQQWLKHYLG